MLFQYHDSYHLVKSGTVVKFLAVLVNIFDVKQILQQENHLHVQFSPMGRVPAQHPGHLGAPAAPLRSGDGWEAAAEHRDCPAAAPAPCRCRAPPGRPGIRAGDSGEIIVRSQA